MCKNNNKLGAKSAGQCVAGAFSHTNALSCTTFSSGEVTGEFAVYARERSVSILTEGKCWVRLWMRPTSGTRRFPPLPVSLCQRCAFPVPTKNQHVESFSVCLCSEPPPPRVGGPVFFSKRSAPKAGVKHRRRILRSLRSTAGSFGHCATPHPPRAATELLAGAVVVVFALKGSHTRGSLFGQVRTF